jgi:hypothetical protein
MAIISTRPSVALVKTRWRKKGERTLADRAGVIGANVWKIALEIFKHMEREGFRFGSDRVVTDVLTEFIAFLVQLVDRIVYEKLSEADRTTLIGEVARHLAATMENNQQDLFGPGEYRNPFIDLLNARFEEYAEFSSSAGAPSYPCLIFFAAKVSDAMSAGDNRWVVEQVIEIEAPEMVRVAGKLVEQTVDIAPR